MLNMSAKGDRTMIYYKDKNIIIRPMKESDCDKFTEGFKEQKWDKPYEQFISYYNQQENGERKVIVAEIGGEVAGYTTLFSGADHGPFAGKNIPEIVDFNVLIKYQGKGIGNKILDVAENLAIETSDVVTLGVGLHHGYGSAQRIYVKRGYIPDGSGVWFNNTQLEQYVSCENNDDLILYLSKTLK